MTSTSTILAFTLSMPGTNSWNGRWSQQDMLHCIVKNLGTSERAKAKAAALEGSHGYDFGDGWYASVSVRKVDAVEARSLRKRSKGFAGYDWMVAELISTGTIKPKRGHQ